MEGANGSKKRKISQVDEVDVDVDDKEEEKMQKFFALIKSLREAREQLMINGAADVAEKEIDDNKRKKSTTKLEEPPSFQREDFIGVAPVKELALIGLVGSSQRSDKEEKAKEGLDLNLSL